MDANVIQEWTACEREEFEALFVETMNQNPSDKMEVLAKSFPEKTMQQQLSGQDHFDGFGDMLCSEIDVETGTNGAASDSYDAYNLLGGDRDDSDLDPSIPLNQPSKQVVVEVAGDPMAVQQLGRKTRRKKRRVWSTEEHRQFLYGVQRLGRGEWKAISKYYVPSRTPAQLASHAQKYFKRFDKNDDLYDKMQNNDAKLSSHDRNNTELSCHELEKVKPTKSSIPQPMSIENISFLDDMSFQDDLVQGMPTFGQTSNGATSLARQMPLNNGTLENLQWETLSTCPTKEQGSVLLDQTREISAEARTVQIHEDNQCRSYSQSLGTANQIHKDDTVLPSVVTALSPPHVPLYVQGRKPKKERRPWSTEEKRQFLYGVQHFGRGEWKAISRFCVPSRTPAQLASYAQKYFKRIEKNGDLYDKTRSSDVNKLSILDHKYTELSGTEPEKVSPTKSSIPQPMSTEDMSFLDYLVQGLPTFGQASNSATNLQMPLNNGTLESSLQRETLSTCPTKEQGSVLLDQTGGISTEARTVPFYRQSLGTANQIHNDNVLLPSVFTAQTPEQVPLYGQGGCNPTNFPSVMTPSNQYNVHSTMPPPF